MAEVQNFASSIANATTTAIVADFNFTFFDQVIYLGCGTLDAPRSESAIQKVMEELNSADPQAHLNVTVAIPISAESSLRLLDGPHGQCLAEYPVNRILFCTRGQSDGSESRCFAFTCAHGEDFPQLFHCHVFRCSIPDVVVRMLLCMASTFNSGAAKSITDSPDNLHHSKNGEIEFEFDIFLEIKETDGKGGFTLAPQEKNCFKLRRGREKRLQVALQQVAGPRVLLVQKCFGLLLAPGRNVKHSDMHLLDMQSVGKGNDDRTYLIEAFWDPNSPQFEVLNTETPKDTRVYVTAAADVVLSGIHEPVRFSLECKARIFHEHERFWYVARKAVVERYYLAVRQSGPPHADDLSSTSSTFEVTVCESASARERRLCRSMGRSPSKMPANLITLPDEDDSDSDEPLLSGSGEVNRECSREVLADWDACLAKWRKDLTQKPKELSSLIRNGIPDALRGEVWQLLAGCYADADMMDTYRLLLSKECPNEQVITRDIHRTFPAHEFFKEVGGVGQESLYKISKAYSLYDEDVGYCQGLSFLAASLLLHVPEEQAFCVLVKIMFDYGLRDLFKKGFEALHLRFYQLQRLIEDYVPDLNQHFLQINVETHMFASQWFLTLFTAKFTLSMVFHIIDLFLSEGMFTIFHISIALLKAWKKELLQLDFEGALKYFRVVLPRKYRTETEAKELIQQAVKVKISHKRLSKYEKEYIALKKQEVETQDPIERLERECLKLKDSVMRLERENDDLAHELVTSKIQLRKNLDAAEDNIECLQGQVEKLSIYCKELEDNVNRLTEESEQVKEMCRREIQRMDEESSRNFCIISNYKQICSDLGTRLEQEQTLNKERIRTILDNVRNCSNCSQIEAVVQLVDDSPRSLNGELINGNPLGFGADPESDREQTRRLELELARTKLALVESQCRAQDLAHQLAAAQQEPKNTWFRKTINSIKDATRNAAPMYPTPPTYFDGSSSTIGGGHQSHSRQNSDPQAPPL